MNSGREKGEMRGKQEQLAQFRWFFSVLPRCACDEESSKADGLGSADCMGLMEGMESVGADWTGSAGVIFSLVLRASI
ncbi:hypothetical protein L3X38_009679 [Prunus dulcis]|uniref:Uncharacterized protein n=1 Tax=Prunus dulcis TaxID=3755 RepID=A0AAD4WEB2_PRUDU|nr:hypothetical protein L3X38_009679 [Prunus dulcis]